MKVTNYGGSNNLGRNPFSLNFSPSSSVPNKVFPPMLYSMPYSSYLDSLNFAQVRKATSVSQVTVYYYGTGWATDHPPDVAD